ncbi:MAG TPA: FmdB family zinc ribbon protein [Methylomirabilota bacterium]|nr:FmdB family zinc ribbon protein [Methylomirabilota bacterium]
MPTYEYECESCHRIYDVLQRITESPITSCKFCSGPVHRLLSAAPFILKGNGWHVTDYPSEARKKGMEKEKPPSSTPSPSSSESTSSSSSSSPSSGSSSQSSSSS